MSKKIIVFGSGAFGSLVLNIIHYLDELKIVAFADDNLQKIGKKIDRIPIYSQDSVVKFAEEKNINSIICAIGNNVHRSNKYNFFVDHNFDLLTIRHPNSLIDTKVKIGKNVIIEMGTAIHTHSKVGNNVFLGGDALVGHHNVIGNQVLIGGNVSLGGSVIIEDYVTIGVGASVKPGVRVGKGAVVGVGAAVINDVKPYSTVVGVPAKEISLRKK